MKKETYLSGNKEIAPHKLKEAPRKRSANILVFFSGTYQQLDVASEKDAAGVDIRYSVCPVAISVTRLNCQPPLQKRNWRAVTLISRRNCWTFERTFYFVFSLDDWYWNDEVLMISGVLEFVLFVMSGDQHSDNVEHRSSYYFRVWTSCTDENFQWLQWSSRILRGNIDDLQRPRWTMQRQHCFI